MDDVLPPLSYAPDGLYESDIDALIAEYFTADETCLPSAVSDRVATNRHTRRLNRQTVNAALRGRLGRAEPRGRRGGLSSPRPGGRNRQEPPAGPGSPNHHEASQETSMVGLNMPDNSPGSAYPPSVEGLLPRVREWAADLGSIPSRNRIMTEFRVGAPKARAILAALNG